MGRQMDARRETIMALPDPVTKHLSPASQALLDFAIVTPGSAASLGLSLFRLLRRLVECFHPTMFPPAKTLSKKKNL